jgi:hypothetical protein
MKELSTSLSKAEGHEKWSEIWQNIETKVTGQD